MSQPKFDLIHWNSTTGFGTSDSRPPAKAAKTGNLLLKKKEGVPIKKPSPKSKKEKFDIPADFWDLYDGLNEDSYITPEPAITPKQWEKANLKETCTALHQSKRQLQNSEHRRVIWPLATRHSNRIVLWIWLFRRESCHKLAPYAFHKKKQPYDEYKWVEIPNPYHMKPALQHASQIECHTRVSQHNLGSSIEYAVVIEDEGPVIKQEKSEIQSHVAAPNTQSRTKSIRDGVSPSNSHTTSFKARVAQDDVLISGAHVENPTLLGTQDSVPRSVEDIKQAMDFHYRAYCEWTGKLTSELLWQKMNPKDSQGNDHSDSPSRAALSFTSFDREFRMPYYPWTQASNPQSFPSPLPISQVQAPQYCQPQTVLTPYNPLAQARVLPPQIQPPDPRSSRLEMPQSIDSPVRFDEGTAPDETFRSQYSSDNDDEDIPMRRSKRPSSAPKHRDGNIKRSHKHGAKQKLYVSSSESSSEELDSGIDHHVPEEEAHPKHYANPKEFESKQNKPSNSSMNDSGDDSPRGAQSKQPPAEVCQKSRDCDSNKANGSRSSTGHSHVAEQPSKKRKYKASSRHDREQYQQQQSVRPPRPETEPKSKSVEKQESKKRNIEDLYDRAATMRTPSSGTVAERKKHKSGKGKKANNVPK